MRAFDPQAILNVFSLFDPGTAEGRYGISELAVGLGLIGEPLADPARGVERPAPPIDARDAEAAVKKTATLEAVKAALAAHGPGTAEALRKAAEAALPGRKITRRRLLEARDELFGAPGRTGRPRRKSPAN